MNNYTEQYLETLLGGYLEETTFQILPDNNQSTVAPQILHGSIEQCLPAMNAANEAGGGVFMCVNETDGLGRSKANVTSVRAVFIDADDTPMVDFALEPSLIVMRDETHWHAYWIVDDCELDMFTGLQERLAEHYDTDRAVKDLPRVMRIAGFLHNKGEPVPVEIAHNGGRAYSCAEVVFAHPLKESAQKAVQKEYSDGEKVPNGERHNFLTTSAGSFRAMGLGETEIFACLKGLRDSRFINPSETPDDNLKKIAQWVANKATGLTIDDMMRGRKSSMQLLDYFSKQKGGFERADYKMEEMPTVLSDGLGAIGTLVRWMRDTSHKLQPELDILAALVAFGALYGRKVKTPSGGRPNLYGVGIAETGSGKDNARQCIKKMFAAVKGLEDVPSAESLASDAALVTLAAENSTSIILWDEFGRALKSLANPDKNPVQYAIITELMKMYTSADGIYKGKAYRDAKSNRSVKYPSVCMYGTTTPDAFHSALTKDSITDGFMGRVLCVWSTKLAPRPIKGVTPLPVPATLIEHLQEWVAPYMGAMDGDAEIIQRTNEADNMLEDFFDSVYDREQEAKKMHGELGYMWGRAAQQADQISLILACSKGKRDNVMIDGDCMRMAISLVVFLTRQKIGMLASEMTTNAVEKRIIDIYKSIKKAGGKGLSKPKLISRTREMRKAERDEAIEHLVDSDAIVDMPSEIRGKIQSVYVTVQNNEASFMNEGQLEQHIKEIERGQK